MFENNTKFNNASSANEVGSSAENSIVDDNESEEDIVTIALRMYSTYFLPFKWIYCGSVLLFLFVSLLYVSLVTPLYRSTAQLYLSNREANITNLRGADYGMNLGNSEAYMKTQCILIGSQEVLAKAFAKCNPGDVRLVSGPQVNSIPETTLVNVSMVSSDPNAAARVTNAVVNEYIMHNQARKSKISNSGIDMMRAQLEEFRVARENATQDLLKFKNDHGIYNLEDNYNTLVAQMNDINKEIMNCELQEQELAIVLKDIKEHREDAANLMPFMSNDGNNNSNLGEIKMLYMQHETQLPELLSKYTQNSAAVSAHRKVGEMLIQAREKEVDNSIAGLQLQHDRTVFRAAKLREQIAKLQERLTQLDLISGEYAMRVTACESIDSSYKLLANRINELNITNAQNEMDSTSVFIVQPAVPASRAFYPNKIRVVFMATVLGFGLALAISFVITLLNNRVVDVETFKSIIGEKIAIFGSVPGFDKNEKELLADNDDSVLAEAFRNIRISMNLSSATHNCRTLVISSTLPHEGKTFISFNLARSFAMDNKKVLYIDFDLRSPRIHKLLEDYLPKNANTLGMSNVLIGDKEICDVVHHIDKFNLDVATSGPLPSNPNELLGTIRLEEIIKKANQEYDMVIIDTPPLLSVSDALVVLRLGMPLVMISRLYTLPKAALYALRKRLGNIRINIAGVIGNNVDIKNMSLCSASNYYASKYEYKYGYSRGYRYGKKKNDANAEEASDNSDSNTKEP